MEKKRTILDEREKLMTELKYLRTTLREVSEAFILRTEGEIETLSCYLSGLSTKDSRHIAGIWLKEVRNTTFKPAKGRFKDLKKIDHLLDDLLERIIESQSLPNSRLRTRKQALTISPAELRADAP